MAATAASRSGATSLKEALVRRVPEVRDVAAFRELRRQLREELGGVDALRRELFEQGFVRDDGRLTTGTTPFNVFALLASGQMQQPNMLEEQQHLGPHSCKFMVCCNRPENDEHWESDHPDWLGKASMSRRHRLLTTTNLHWQWFNTLVLGLVPAVDGGSGLAAAIDEVESLKDAALTYASRAGSWSQNVGLFFHVYGHNSVNSLHLHVLDMDALGPTGRKYAYKNCPLDAVLQVLREELVAASQPARPPPPLVAPVAAEGADQRQGQGTALLAGLDFAQDPTATLAPGRHGCRRPRDNCEDEPSQRRCHEAGMKKPAP